MMIELTPATLAGFDARAAMVERGIRMGFDDLEQGGTALTAVLATVERSPRPSPWSSYWAWSRGDDCYVGLCAFKALPADSMVEIAYYTYPRLEGRSIATQMAAAQIAIATAHKLQVVRAHTLPQRNASGSVLARLGFARIGEVIDPEDGLVWRWERAVVV